MKNPCPFLLFLFILNISGFYGRAEISSSGISLIPMPQQLIVHEGHFLLNQLVNIRADAGLEQEAAYLQAALFDVASVKLQLSQAEAAERSIRLKLDPAVQGAEAYRISSNGNRYEIAGKTGAGVFYGIRTFLQLIPVQAAAEINLPLVSVSDGPRFEWRGMHLDVCRHFYSVELVKKLLDEMAKLKLNTFHWHLTDDQGWRIEIKKYPELTQTGAWRKETKIGHMADYPHRFDGQRHGGFYTQEEIREVVAYAQQRHITIVPEIELPGHAQAAIAAYPGLGCFNDTLEAWTLWGVSEHVFCAGKESTFQFLEDVLSEVIDLFPGTFVHVGGDECPKTHWKECTLCRQRIEEEGLKDEHELQSYFIRRMERFLSLKGKKLIGWDEILEGGLAGGAVIMSWRGEKGGVNAAKLGHQVVMTPGEWCYFDYFQSANPNEPIAIGGLTDLAKVYGYDPVPAQLDAEKQKLILGTQANVWTEYIPTAEQLEYMIFPRLCALAEVMWTEPGNKDFAGFEQRMDKQYLRMAKDGVRFRVPPPEGLDPIHTYAAKEAIIALSCPVPSAKIRYTLDGSEPTERSAEYLKALRIKLDEDKILRAVTILADGTKSYPVSSLLRSRNMEPVKLRNLQKGLNYRFFDGPFRSFKEVGGEPELTGTVDWLIIPVQTMSNLKGWIFDGYISIYKDGLYRFQLSSACGSGLYIGNELVIDNDGFNYDNVRSGLVELKAGFYPVRVKYFSTNAGQRIRLYYQPPWKDKFEVFPGEKYYR
ncbi:family 20 glycosylhydrolase [Gaoshiqia sp. Z1-71]|uniref:family 20 glycosylhydrolase n=1 Tax=Gaoshiqia hydrogeniformans TaxID=3290090 RepID=UPI003BF856B2